MNKTLFAISLAKKAGKLIYGHDQVRKETLSGKTFVIILASDLSEKTASRVEFFAKDIVDIYKVKETQYELANIMGRLTGILAITDENLANLFIKSMID